jgi:hypothetical protein
MMGINAVKGVEIGAGFDSVSQRGTVHGDELTPEGFRTNNSGGVLGGISTGQDIKVSLAIKPTSSIRTARESIDKAGSPASVETFGRHDPCVGIRATPIAEAMLALVLMDHALRHRAQCGDVRVDTRASRRKHRANLSTRVSGSIDPGTYLRFGLFYLGYYGYVGVISPYVSLFFADRGYSPVQIGVLMACFQLSRIVGPYLWGWLSDVMHTREAVAAGRGHGIAGISGRARYPELRRHDGDDDRAQPDHERHVAAGRRADDLHAAPPRRVRPSLRACADVRLDRLYRRGADGRRVVRALWHAGVSVAGQHDAGAVRAGGLRHARRGRRRPARSRRLRCRCCGGPTWPGFSHRPS